MLKDYSSAAGRREDPFGLGLAVQRLSRAQDEIASRSLADRSKSALPRGMAQEIIRIPPRERPDGERTTVVPAGDTNIRSRALRERADAGCLQPLGVEEVLRPARGELRREDVVEREDPDVRAAERDALCALVSLLELEARDRREDVDAHRCDANLINDLRLAEIASRQRRGRRTKRTKRLQDPLCVLLRGPARTRDRSSYPCPRASPCAP